MAKSHRVLLNKVQSNKSVYGVSTGLGGSGARSHLNYFFRHMFLIFFLSVRNARTPTHSGSIAHSGHANEQYNRTRTRPRAAPPHWRAAVRSVPPGRPARPSVIGPAYGDEHA